MKEWDDDPEVVALLASIKEALPELEPLLENASSHWGYEDAIYRYYHQSFKVYRVQDTTLEIVEALRALAPHRELNEWFMHIVADGTGKEWESSHNADWERMTRPMLEAFFHARYFLEMAVKHGRELERPPAMMPSGWAGVLCLYGLR